jgi:hypothetical protein
MSSPDSDKDGDKGITSSQFMKTLTRPDIHPGVEPSYGTATVMSASSGSKLPMSACKQKRPANVTPICHLSSFTEANEHGPDSLNPVVQGYDDTRYTRLESPSPPCSLEEKST